MLLPQFFDSLSPYQTKIIRELRQHLAPLPHLSDLLTNALVDNPPALIREGGVIAKRVDEELDELRALSENANDQLQELELFEKSKSGLSTLKFALIGFKDITLNYRAHCQKKFLYIFNANKP